MSEFGEFEKTFLKKYCFVIHQSKTKEYYYNGIIISVSDGSFMIEDEKTGNITSLPMNECVVKVKE